MQQGKGTHEDNKRSFLFEGNPKKLICKFHLFSNVYCGDPGSNVINAKGIGLWDTAPDRNGGTYSTHSSWVGWVPSPTPSQTDKHTHIDTQTDKHTHIDTQTDKHTNMYIHVDRLTQTHTHRHRLTQTHTDKYSRLT